MSKLSHLDDEGRLRMVDISEKEQTQRRAIAVARVKMRPETIELIAAGRAAKGNVLCCAQLAGINAAKRTAELIPLCHPLSPSFLDVRFELGDDAIVIEAEARVREATGVEMEALTAAAVAALTIYDMCKAVDRGMTIEGLGLRLKEGGRSGRYEHDADR